MMNTNFLLPGARSILDGTNKRQKRSKSSNRKDVREQKMSAKSSSQSRRARINDGHPVRESDFIVIAGGFIDSVPSQPLATRPFTLNQTANGNVQVGINPTAVPLPTTADLMALFGIDPEIPSDRTQYIMMSGLADADELLFNTMFAVVGFPSSTSPVIILEPVDFISSARRYRLGKGSFIGFHGGAYQGVNVITEIDCTNLTVVLKSTGNALPVTVVQRFIDNYTDDSDDYDSDCTSPSTSSSSDGW